MSSGTTWQRELIDLVYLIFLVNTGSAVDALAWTN